jgi:hypothetical protein
MPSDLDWDPSQPTCLLENAVNTFAKGSPWKVQIKNSQVGRLSVSSIMIEQSRQSANLLEHVRKAIRR